MEKKLKLFLQLGFASTLVFCASALIGLTLALDTWRSATIVENKISTHYTQGIFKECIRNSTHKKVCHDWRMSKYSKEFYRKHNNFLLENYDEVNFVYYALSCVRT